MLFNYSMMTRILHILVEDIADFSDESEGEDERLNNDQYESASEQSEIEDNEDIIYM